MAEVVQRVEMLAAAVLEEEVTAQEMAKEKVPQITKDPAAVEVVMVVAAQVLVVLELLL